MSIEKGFYHPQRGYWQTTGGVSQRVIDGYPEGTIEVPIKPSANHVWQDGAWVEVIPDPAIELAAWRTTAKLSRRDFCIALKRAGILASSEAIAASKGDWPTTFASALSGLPQDAQDEAQIEWAAVQEIRRNHPMIGRLGASAGLTDAQIDALFGWGV
jgi:hypothetical protein